MTNPKPKSRISAKSVFAESVALPAHERAAFLDNVCRTAPKMRVRVEAMLADHDRRVSAPAGETHIAGAGTSAETATVVASGAETAQISPEVLEAATEPWFVPVEEESWREEIADGGGEDLDGAEESAAPEPANEPLFAATEAESWREERSVHGGTAAYVAAYGAAGNEGGTATAVAEYASETLARPGLHSTAERLESRQLGAAYQAMDERPRRPAAVYALAAERRGKARARGLMACAVLLVLAASVWLLRWNTQREWAHEQAIPEVESLLKENKPLAAWQVLEKAQGILPADSRLKGLADENAEAATITTDPAGAMVEIQDYLDQGDEWQKLGTTPLTGVRIPKGYFRWRLSKDGLGTLIVAPKTAATMSFSLAEAQKAPAGMVYDAGGMWEANDAVPGIRGPISLPAAYIDRYEVTNREYQAFVDRSGYATRAYWPAAFQQNGRAVPWSEGMAQFHDATGRPGPSTWENGHYPRGQADFPVSGVSWFEAAAYATYAGKALPAVVQWYQADPPELAAYMVQLNNLASNGPDAVGTYRGVGPFGTYDMGGNVREWLANGAEDDLRVVAGGSWKSRRQAEGLAAVSPYDRSDVNGFRCVRNLGALPDEAAKPVRVGR